VGVPVQILGTTHPRVRGARIWIGYEAIERRTSGAIGVARTDARGRFGLSWTPRQKGTFTITAAYRHPARGLVADRSCDLGMTVG
jgi:hypothetical protein